MLHRSRDGLVMSELGNGVRDIFCILNNKKGLGGEPEGMKVFVYLSRGGGQTRLTKVGPSSPEWDQACQGGSRALQGGTRALQGGTRALQGGIWLTREGPEY